MVSSVALPEDVLRMKKNSKTVTLTFPLPSLLVPGGGEVGGRPDSPAISKTIAPMNVKFCRILDTSLNILEMLKLFT